MLLFYFNLNKEAYATSKNEGGDKSPFMESFMQNMEVDLRLSYGFYMHHHYEMEGYRTHFPIFELSLQKRIVKFGFYFDLVYDSNDILRNIKTGTEWSTRQILNPGAHIAGELLMGKTSFMFVVGKHFGEYMHTEESYQRLGLKINFSKHIYGKVTLWDINDTSPTSSPLALDFNN